MSSLPVLCPPVCLLKVRDCTLAAITSCQAPLAAITSCQAPSTCPPPSRRPPNFPPGLVRLPLVGHLPKGSKPNMEFWGTRKVMQENSGVARSLLRCWACSWATSQVFKYRTLHWPRIYSTGGWLIGKHWIWLKKKRLPKTVWLGLKNPLYGQIYRGGQWQWVAPNVSSHILPHLCSPGRSGAAGVRALFPLTSGPTRGRTGWLPSCLIVLVQKSFVVQGIITTDGQEWTETRRFTLKHLKDFGFGRAGLEGVIQGEVA